MRLQTSLTVRAADSCIPEDDLDSEATASRARRQGTYHRQKESLSFSNSVRTCISPKRKD